LALDQDQRERRQELLSSTLEAGPLAAEPPSERSDQMAEKDDVPTDSALPQRIPFMQRLLDNPFLLLFLGVTIPTVFYILWGVMELTQVPVAR
jgi:hypothetical protein